jgi:kinesin family member C1
MGAGTSQDDVYAAVSDVVQSALDGYQVCLFSYGQTGSGKTHTMNGNPACARGRGIIPRAVHGILENTLRLGPAGWEFRLEAMYIEIYNETLRDLLAAPTSAPGARSGVLDGNSIKHESSGHTQVHIATLLCWQLGVRKHMSAAPRHSQHMRCE